MGNYWRTGAELQRRARELRLNSTEAEAALWEALRERRLRGAKFRRQHPLGHRIVDFCCLEAHLVVEVDGPIHRAHRLEDELRSDELAELGYRVLRFANEGVLGDLNGVLARIARWLDEPEDLGEAE